MNSTFPFAKGRDWGYYPEDVDTFIANARKVYDETFAQLTPGLPPGHASIKAQDIRQVSFRRARGGYSAEYVDEALDRLENVFLEREKAVFISQLGEAAWQENLAKERVAIVEHASRKAKYLFRRVGSFSSGYHIGQVRDVVARVLDHFTAGAPLSVADIRTAQFKSKKGGYNEAQVDAFLDSVINVLSHEDGSTPVTVPVAAAPVDTTVVETADAVTATAVLTETLVVETPDEVIVETVEETFAVPASFDAPVSEPVIPAAPSSEPVSAEPTPAAQSYVPPTYPPIVPTSYQPVPTQDAPVPSTSVPQTSVPPVSVPPVSVPPVATPSNPAAEAAAVAAAWATGGVSTGPISAEEKSEEKPDEDDFFAQFK